MNKLKLAKKVANELRDLTTKLIDDPILTEVVNQWASEHGLVFKHSDRDFHEKDFEIKAPGYDFSWKHFPGYKTVWVDHPIGISAKFGFNHNLKKPLAVIDLSQVSDKTQ